VKFAATRAATHHPLQSARGQYVPAVIPETHRDLMDGPLTAILTTIGEDGLPQSSAVWYCWEDDRLLVSTKRWAAKFRNAEARPPVGFIVVDPADEFRYVEIRGTATTAEDPGCALRDRIRAKHGIGADAPDPAAADRVVMTIEPVRVVAFGR
jgi:PPOX class probable F420-dependent enzyme